MPNLRTLLAILELAWKGRAQLALENAAELRAGSSAGTEAASWSQAERELDRVGQPSPVSSSPQLVPYRGAHVQGRTTSWLDAVSPTVGTDWGSRYQNCV